MNNKLFGADGISGMLTPVFQNCPTGVTAPQATEHATSTPIRALCSAPTSNHASHQPRKPAQSPCARCPLASLP